MHSTQVLIVGSGPIGIACGIEARRRAIPALIVEKGCLLNSISRFPPHLVFFSTPQLLELAGIPFVTADQKPNKQEILYYYRRLVEHFGLDVRLYEAVERIEPAGGGGYSIHTSRSQVYSAPFVILAIGFFDHPNLLAVPGEDLPKVSHYYGEPQPYYRQQVAVIGGQNSAVEAALELHRNGARVTLIHRGPGLGSGVKYWLRPDIENRIKEGAIRALFNTRVERIDPDSITLQNGSGARFRIENDFVLAMTGYHTDGAFLERAGIGIDPETLKPKHDPATLETNLPGVYIAGVAAGGREANKIFIENSRVHAGKILEDIARRVQTSPGTA